MECNSEFYDDRKAGGSGGVFVAVHLIIVKMI